MENQGRSHFQVPPGYSDEDLFADGYDRVYDTLELETNLNDTEAFVRPILEHWPVRKPVSSWQLCRAIGQALNDRKRARGVVRSAFRKKVPIFIPAFSDSELGLDFATHNHLRRRDGRPPLAYDPFDDLDTFAELCRRQTRLGIFTIGGGVPRNWAQQVGPYLDLKSVRLGQGPAFKPFQFGVRICPDPPHWGHLSGCTYSEGISWGKFVPTEMGGQFAEVLDDATIVWPLVVRAVIDRLDEDKKKHKKKKKTAPKKLRAAAKKR